MKEIPLFKVVMNPEAASDVAKVLESGFIGQGPRVDELEDTLKRRFESPYLLAVNSGTSAEQLAWMLLREPAYNWAGLKDGDEVLCTPLTCLWGGSSVLLEDGTVRLIKHLVEEKYSGRVISYNEQTGVFEAKRVINWYTSPVSNRYWVNVSYEHSIGDDVKTRKTKGTWVTNDHLVLTTDGYREAGSLIGGEKILVNESCPTSAQAGLLFGMMLGDSHLQSAPYSGRKSRLQTAHAVKFEEYMLLKQQSLKGLGYRPTSRSAYKQSSPATGWETPFLSSLGDLFARFYPKGIKRIPEDFKTSELTLLGLAAWFFDDGHLHKRDECAVICTDSFSYEDVLKLINALEKEFELCASAQRNIRNGKEFHRIYFCRKQAEKLSSLIAPYAPPCMRYKIHSTYRESVKFDPSLWGDGKSRVYVDNVRIRKGKEDVPRPGRTISKVYCIDVEDNHNFVSGGVIVHNCTASNWPVALARLKIKWVDIDPETLNMDLKDLERKVTPTTRAIQLVHWGGYPNDLDAIKGIQVKTQEIMGFKPAVLEDCAHAFGSMYKGRSVGTQGNISTFSMQAIKHVTSVDGGFIILPHHDLWKEGDLLKWYGIDRRGPRSDFRCEEDVYRVGNKWHMNDVMATVGLSNLKIADNIIKKHKENAAFYDRELKGIEGLKVLTRSPGFDSSFWIYSLLVEDRGSFTKWMKECGISVSQVHERNDKHTCMREYRTHLPNLDATIGKITHIPVGSWVTNEDRQYIVDCIRKGW